MAHSSKNENSNSTLLWDALATNLARDETMNARFWSFTKDIHSEKNIINKYKKATFKKSFEK